MFRMLIIGFMAMLMLVSGALDSFATVVQYQIVNAGLTGTEIREIRDGKLAGFRYENSFLGTRNYEQGFITNITTGVSSTYMYSDGARGVAVSTQIYAISTTDNNRYGGMAYFGEFLPVRVYGFTRESNGSAAIVEPSGVSNSSVEGIYGNSSVGWAVQSGKKYGYFQLDSGASASFYRLDYNKPGFGLSSSTEATGIYGSIIVGTTVISGVNYGFAYNASNGTFSNPYLASGASATFFNDFNDGVIAGTATVAGTNTPFIFNPYTDQLEYFTSVEGYSASGRSYDNGVLAGTITTQTGEKLGFYANVPEPKSHILVLISASLGLVYRRRRKS